CLKCVFLSFIGCSFDVCFLSSFVSFPSNVLLFLRAQVSCSEMRDHSYSFLLIRSPTSAWGKEWFLGSCGVFLGVWYTGSFPPFLGANEGFLDVLFRDSKLTMLLSESLGNINCRTTMIAHISDSPANYMETLTTVQLASRIHRMRKKKSKYASNSSGGESSCEEGPSHRPPHLRPFHPRTIALDPDTPLLLSSDPDYSSSSEHSCDTVIYVGPGGAAISDRELSDNEGPPSFVPIIPSLNKLRVKDAPRSDGNHLKCNTFAELQERLDCIDGSEGPATFGTEGKTTLVVGFGTQTGAGAVSPPTSDKNSFRFLESTPTQTNKPDQDQHTFVSVRGIVETSKRTSADGEKLSPVVREKVYLKGGLPKPAASTPLSWTDPAASQCGDVVGRTPPVGMSQQALRQGQPAGSAYTERVPLTTRGHMEFNNLRAALLGRCLDRDIQRTTVTLQQPVELNGEDELVFTVVEELPFGLVPDNGRPSNLLSFNTDCSWQAAAYGSRPVSIISSINDEYDAFTSQQGAVGPGPHVGTNCQETWFSQQGNSQPTIGSWASEVNALSEKTASSLTSPSTFHKQPFLQQGIKSSLHDSGICFSELASDPATPNKSSFSKCHASLDPNKFSLKDPLKARRNTLNTSTSASIPPRTTHSSLPRKTKPTSSATVGCSRQEGRHDNFSLQGSRYFESREVEFLSAGKPRSGTSSASPKRPGLNSNSVPRPPKAQMSQSTQRIVDGCERASSRKSDTLIKLPRLTRGATTLGTVSTPQSSESTLGPESPSVSGTLRFSSLGKKSNGQKSSMTSKAGTGNISPPAQPVRQSSQEQKTRTVLSHRTCGLKTEHGFARTSSSLRTRGAKAESSMYYGSLMSLERCDSQTLTGSKPELFRENSGATQGGSNKSNRSVPRLGVPASDSTSVLGVTGFTGPTSKLGQIKGNSSSRPAAVSGGAKVRTLSASSSKSLSSEAGRPTSLPPTGKSPARSGIGAKMGRGTIMGTKYAISRAANSRVSELVTGSQRKQLGRGSGLTENDGTDSRTSSVSGSPNSTLLPSPYSKITAPRRPQRYSSGHGSDNSSVLSGELPPAMGRTALFDHSGGSSGYESMIRDSETTGSTSSAHDSMSEGGVSSSNRSRVSKSPKKRGNGFQRRRLIPAPLPDTSSLGRKVGGQWVELPSLGGALKEPFEIKVYEIDDVDCLQRRKEGLLYFNARLRMLEKRQQQIRDLRSKQESLQEELEEAKSCLMLHPDRWIDVDQDLDPESQEYLEALAQVTAELEDCVNLCKSRVMMETCFDIAVAPANAATQGGQQEVEV
uniref:Kinesin family member 26Aa n=1 Tax=Labrus bergylta TaxID=56723 RepID=A0A3Q3FA04_9LABR